jgi:manganese transport protein
VGLEPTRLLILSQVILSFGIPFALVPLVRIAADRDLMHLVPIRRATIWRRLVSDRNRRYAECDLDR